MTPTPSSFDPIAPLYHRLWKDWYLPAAMPALERTFFSRVAPPASVLDLCCGSGHVTRELVRRGYKVTGIDASSELLAIAAAEIPHAEFHHQDARALRLPRRFQAALSTFDSLNHILELEGLAAAFKGVHKHLEPHGLFVFDMNLQEAFRADMRAWAVDTSEASVSLIRGLFDDDRKVARTELIWFERDGNDNRVWRRADSTVEEKCYTQTEIVNALQSAGFNRIESFTAAAAGMQPELGFGRLFIQAVASG